MKFSWKMRIGVVLSAVWICISFLTAGEHQQVGQMIGLGFLPLVIVWGIAWAVSGWRTQRPAKSLLPDEVLLEKKGRRLHSIRTFVAVFFVLAIGLFSATWQFHAANNEAGGQEVGYWAGQWMVYGLFAYLALSLPLRKFPGMAALLAAILVVGAVNYKAFDAIKEDRLALISLAKATPFINKIQSGTPVSDQDVKNAQVGMLEPLLLAQAAYSREIMAITATYTKEIAELQPELMLTPRSLVSPSIRAHTRASLKLWQRTTSDYQAQLNAAMARGKLGVQAAKFHVPSSMARSASKGFDKVTVELNAYIDILVSSEKEASDTVGDILDLMDGSLGTYSIDNGPPVNLLFRDEAALARYRQLMDIVASVGLRETEAHNRLIKLQSVRTDDLTNLLNR